MEGVTILLLGTLTLCRMASKTPTSRTRSKSAPSLDAFSASSALSLSCTTSAVSASVFLATTVGTPSSVSTTPSNSALVAIDFCVRHGLVEPSEPGYLETLALLRVGRGSIVS